MKTSRMLPVAGYIDRLSLSRPTQDQQATGAIEHRICIHSHPLADWRIDRLTPPLIDSEFIYQLWIDPDYPWFYCCTMTDFISEPNGDLW